MISLVLNEVWAFDCEWVPDLTAGRLLYGLSDECPTEEVLHVMWEQGGATPENPQPFLRLIHCRIVSIAMVIRQVLKDKTVRLSLKTLPSNPDDPAQRKESEILRLFLEEGVGKRAPQLVGFNSRNADLRILQQRALIKGMRLPGFSAQLSAKPWEQTSIDLMDILCGFGKTYGATLNELATLSGIPGKLDVSGDDVCGLWFQGKYREICDYNCFDALSTYLLWLRTAYFSGCFSPEQYSNEQAHVRQLIMEEMEKPHGAYLKTYLDAWDHLQQRKSDAEALSE